MRVVLTVVAGSYKQYIKCPERYMTLIPDGVSDYVAGPVMCSASTIYSSIKESGLRAGEWAVFPGTCHRAFDASVETDVTRWRWWCRHSRRAASSSHGHASYCGGYW